MPTVLNCCVQVARCTKIINPGTDEAKYVINVKQLAKASPAVSLRGSFLLYWRAMLLLSSLLWGCGHAMQASCAVSFLLLFGCTCVLQACCARGTCLPACSNGIVLHNSHPLMTLCRARLQC